LQWEREIEGGDSPTLLRSDETPPGVLRPSLEPPAQEGHVAVGVGPEEATKMIQEGWSTSPVRKG